MSALAQTDEALAAAYKDGGQIRDLARAHGCSQKQIYDRLLQQGAIFRPATVRGRPGGGRARTENVDGIAKAYTAGVAVLDICATFGVTRGIVGRVVGQAGVKRRPSGAPRETDWAMISRLIDEGRGTRDVAAAASCSPRQVARALKSQGYHYSGRRWRRPQGTPATR
ncbi:hypothetical protein ACFWYW_46500 [Nonomuraea sp. NPDC059023]|uniref:hypothetical protein n=1 Tax=unclassified Nonomuraea TaxID=2593643 RepID=UPI0036CCC144